MAIALAFQRYKLYVNNLKIRQLELEKTQLMSMAEDGVVHALMPPVEARWKIDMMDDLFELMDAREATEHGDLDSTTFGVWTGFVNRNRHKHQAKRSSEV